MVQVGLQAAAWMWVIELPLAPSFPLAGMESLEGVELELAWALSVSIAGNDLVRVQGSEPQLAR